MRTMLKLLAALAATRRRPPRLRRRFALPGFGQREANRRGADTGMVGFVQRLAQPAANGDLLQRSTQGRGIAGLRRFCQCQGFFDRDLEVPEGCSRVLGGLLVCRHDAGTREGIAGDAIVLPGGLRSDDGLAFGAAGDQTHRLPVAAAPRAPAAAQPMLCAGTRPIPGSFSAGRRRSRPNTRPNRLSSMPSARPTLAPKTPARENW